MKKKTRANNNPFGYEGKPINIPRDNHEEEKYKENKGEKDPMI